MPSGFEGEWIDDELVVIEEKKTDSANLGANSTPGPGSVEEASATNPTEPQPATQVEMSESAGTPEVVDLPEFDPRYKQAFEGLLYLGYLQDSFQWLGHKFVIQTLNTEQIIEVGQVHAKYQNTLGDTKAYQSAVVAGALVSVDGKPLPIPLTTDPDDTPLRNAFNVVVRWFPPAIDHIYERYLVLESKVEKVIEALGKA